MRLPAEQSTRNDGQLSGGDPLLIKPYCGLPTAASSSRASVLGDEATGETIEIGSADPSVFFLALAWARRIPNGSWRVSASLARAGVSFLIMQLSWLDRFFVLLNGVLRFDSVPRFAPRWPGSKTCNWVLPHGWTEIGRSGPKIVYRD